jgi:hypothetical protein
MKPIRLPQRATCLTLAAFITLGILSGLNVLAAPGAAATSMQLVVAAPCAKA